MKRLFPCCCVAALLSGQITAIAQDAAPKPSPTIRATTDLVVVDVVVTDNHQNPVRGLKASDFAVLEDGHPQSIKSFEESAASAPAPRPSMPKLAPGTFTNYSVLPPTSGALNILLLDRLNTPMQDQMVMREQILKYLKDDRSGTPMAIFGLSSHLQLLQGFTSDPELLRAAVSGKKGNAQGSHLMDNPVSGDNPGDDNPVLDAEANSSNANPAVVANLTQFLAEQQAFQLQQRARYTLDALNNLGRYLSRLPGRKNLIWFSGSFPISILPDTDLANPFSVVASSEDEFRETVGLLALSQVSVYPIDARGLVSTPMLNAMNSGHKYASRAGSFGQDNLRFSQQNASEHATMNQMAEATGGKAFVNTNGLKEAVEKAITAGSNYYTLSYSPSNKNWKGEYRKIAVKTERQGVTLAYRRGYFADDPTAPTHHGEKSKGANAPQPFNAMQVAMLRGGPFPTQILFKVSVRPSNGAEESTIAPSNRSNANMKGPYRRYSVYFTASPSDIHCSTINALHHCELEFVTNLYDPNGVLQNVVVNGIRGDLTNDNYALIMREGIQFVHEVSIPVKGEYFLRCGVHDMLTDHVGAVELPVSSVSKLPPLSAQNAAPAPTHTNSPAAGNKPAD